MLHKLVMLRSKNYSLVFEHLWPFDFVDLTVKHNQNDNMINDNDIFSEQLIIR